MSNSILCINDDLLGSDVDVNLHFNIQDQVFNGEIAIAADSEYVTVLNLATEETFRRSLVSE